jgi:hypothetical protein
VSILPAVEQGAQFVIRGTLVVLVGERNRERVAALTRRTPPDAADEVDRVIHDVVANSDANDEPTPASGPSAC